MNSKFIKCYQVKDENGGHIGYVEQEYDRWVFVPDNFSIQTISRKTLQDIVHYMDELESGSQGHH